jgi:signal transduction histidine kinase/PAS domain-containing protein
MSNPEIFSNQIASTIFSSGFDLFVSDEPFIILNKNYDVIFLNDTFRYSELYNHYFDGNDKHLAKLKEDIRVFAGSSFNFSRLNLQIPLNDTDRYIDYIINISRVRLSDNELYILKYLDATKLLERENRIASIQSALEMMKIPLLVTSSKGNVIYVSEEFEKTFDLSIEALHNKFFCLAFENILSKEDLLTLEKAFLRGETWSKTFSFQTNDEKIKYKEIRLVPSSRFIKSERLNLIVIYDVTSHIEEKNVAEALAHRITTILDNITDPVFIIKDEKNYFSLERANKCFYELFNTNHTHLGSNIEKIIDKEFFSLIKTNISLLQNSNTNKKDFEFFYRNNYFKAKISSLQTAQDEQIYVISLNNITNEIEYQHKINEAYKKEISLNRLKNSFIENISHEIRTPFHAISGYSELIEEALKNDDYGTIQEIISLLKDVLGRVTKLFDNLIELSHVESGDIIFDFNNVNPNKIVKVVYDGLITRAIEKGIQLLLDLGDIKNLIRVDIKKLEKVIYSLVDNSIKYTHYGNVAIRTYQQNEKVYIAITDTGEGMNQHEIHELIQPFSQEEDAFTRKYQGMGLGLTVAYRLTKLMGGDVEIISQKSVGTKVIISFNLV